MDLDFDLFFTVGDEFLKCSAVVKLEYIGTFLFISKIHSNSEIRDQILRPSKVVTFLYVGTCLCKNHVLLKYLNILRGKSLYL